MKTTKKAIFLFGLLGILSVSQILYGQTVEAASKQPKAKKNNIKLFPVTVEKGE